MHKFVLALIIVYALSYQCVFAGDECEEDLKKFRKGIHDLIEGGEIPCVGDFDLARFQFTGGEDEEKDKEQEEKFKSWAKEQDEETQKVLVECLKEMSQKSIENLGSELSEECKDKIEERLYKI